MPVKAAREVSSAPRPASVLSRAVIRAAEHLQLSRAALARVLGLSAASVTRLHQGSLELEPDSKPGELGLLLVRLFRSLDSIVGDREAAGAFVEQAGHRDSFADAGGTFTRGQDREPAQAAEALQPRPTSSTIMRAKPTMQARVARSALPPPRPDSAPLTRSAADSPRSSTSAWATSPSIGTSTTARLLQQGRHRARAVLP